MAKLGAVVDDWMRAADVKISAVQCWTSLEENLRRRAVHDHEHDERFAAVERVRSGCLRSAGDARAGAGFGNAERAARLEQQLRRRSEQSGLLPLQQFAEAFLPRSYDGFSGHHCGHGRQGQYVRDLRGPREIGADELCAIFDGRSDGKIRGYMRRGNLPTIRWRRSAARASWKFREMQKLLRYICENGFEHHVAANFSTVAPVCMKRRRIYLAGKCTRTEQ